MTKRTIFNTLATAAIFGVNVFSYAATPTIEEKTFLEINDTKIPYSQIIRKMESFPGIQGAFRGQLQQDSLLVYMANQILQEQVFVQLAKSKGIYPTEQEITAKKEEITMQNPAVFSTLKQKGFSDEELNEFIASDLVQYKLLTHGITVTPEDVKAYYDNNSVRFTDPQKYELSLIIAKDENDRKAIDEDLKTKDFATVAASELNASPSKSKSGHVGEIPVSALNPEQKKAIESAESDAKDNQPKISGWLKFGQAEGKFLVHKNIAAVKRPLDAETHKQIHDQLMIERGQEKNNLEAMFKQAVKDAKINYNHSFGKESFDKFILSTRGEDQPLVVLPTTEKQETETKANSESKKESAK